MWQSAWDDQTIASLSQLEEMVSILGKRAYFTPRFESYNGSKVGCHYDDEEGEASQRCRNNIYVLE